MIREIQDMFPGKVLSLFHVKSSVYLSQFEILRLLLKFIFIRSSDMFPIDKLFLKFKKLSTVFEIVYKLKKTTCSYKILLGFCCWHLKCFPYSPGFY